MKELFSASHTNTGIQSANSPSFQECTLEVTWQTFEKVVLDSPKLAIVYFYKQDSESCTLFEEELQHLQRVFADRVTFLKVNAATTGSRSTRPLTSKLVKVHKVDGVPMLLFFKNHKEIHRVKGIVMREKLQKIIEGTLLVEDVAEALHPES